MAASRAVADTSVFVALETGRSVDRATIAAYVLSVSVLTQYELALGVELASDASVRRARQATLAFAESFEGLPVDGPVAAQLTRIVARLRTAGRRVNLVDAAIAATAAAHGVPVLSQDGDFAAIAEHSAGAVEAIFV